VVEEFFELFKTPWETYRSGHSYDVVIASVEEIPEVNTKLLLLYGPAPKNIDARIGVAARERRRRAVVSDGHTQIPIYGELLTLAEGTGQEVTCLTAGSEIAGVRVGSPDSLTIRLGYDLFQEVQFLLSEGQPAENAHIPTLDIHIRMLREWILNAGIPLVEIPPVPAGHSFSICLTHDIDFVGIRNHCFDHTMWGFLYRSTIGATRNFFRSRISLPQLLKSWEAAASLPLVYLGWVEDFWDPFDWYLQVEKSLPATYFLIPFKRRPGENVSARHASRRAAAYDIGDLPHWTTTLMKEGCELGVHGIDAWHSVEKGRDELARIAAVSGESSIGIRMHWLLRDANTLRVLEEAGYNFDSTVGYNETIGYRSGTAQVFRPGGAQSLLELPLHIQDGALFYRQRLDLSEPEAWERCAALINHAREFGGVLTVLWHDRSHAPERFWGGFYVRLVRELRSLDSWFGTAGQVVGWFRKRREVRFERVEATDASAHIRLRYHGQEISPPLSIRVHRSNRRSDDLGARPENKPDFVDIPWNGEIGEELNHLLRTASDCLASLTPAGQEAQTSL
jgi:hypothetical protein